MDALRVEVPRAVAQRAPPGLALHLGPEDGEQQVVRAAFEQVAREGMEQVVDGAPGRERQAEPGQAG
ncbi:hypothetical protein [Streptomyces globosus]|uniref:hypothetical protein n=1 Tax=Streptomyces globosus TaxID=68209 RepID=UPI00382EE4E9